MSHNPRAVHRLAECRGAIDIPVIGFGEANLLCGCTLGRKIGLVTIDPVFIPWHEEQITRHGLERRVAGVSAIEADLPRFMAAFEDPATQAQVRDDFIRQVEPMVAAGADVLIPAGGLPMLLFAEQQPFLVHGAVVLEVIATVLKAAEMAISLHRVTGVAASRRGMFTRAPVGAIQDFLTPRLWDLRQRSGTVPGYGELNWAQLVGIYRDGRSVAQRICVSPR